MLQFNLMTDKDVRDAAALEKRRQFDEERKKRIFNPKYRKFGVDFEALEKQICEKKKREEAEKLAELSFYEQRKQMDKTVRILEMQEKQEKQRIMDEINRFRLAYQKKEDRREFDLYDPDYFKKLIPARIHDDDPRCGPSSAQKFEGEDLGEDDRKSLQKEQLKAWLDQQIAEKRSADKERKDAEDAYKAAIISRDMRSIELDQKERNCRKQIDLELACYNKALAEERTAKAKLQKQQETEDGMAEIYNNIMSDMLTENPESAESNFGPGRKITSMYKGLTKEQKEKQRLDLLAQIDDEKQRKLNAERVDLEWNAVTNKMNLSIAYMDDEVKKKRKKEFKKILEENKKLGEEQRTHNLYLEKVVYRNSATAAFYEQFNKTTR